VCKNAECLDCTIHVINETKGIGISVTITSPSGLVVMLGGVLQKLLM